MNNIYTSLSKDESPSRACSGQHPIKNGLIILFLFFFTLNLNSQQVVSVKKSEVISEIDGRIYFIHSVKKGQTAYSISKAYHISIDQLYEENSGTADGLITGQTLKIPVPENQKLIDGIYDADNKVFKHIVKRSQTLYGISRKYEITIDDIYRYNPKAKEGLLFGQIIEIPVNEKWIEENIENENILKKENTIRRDTLRPDTTQKTIIEHIVRYKETLYSISRKYGVSIDDICDKNHGARERLLEGRILKIPVEKKEKDQVSAPVHQGIKKDEEKSNKLIEHIVQRKETLYSISIKYDVSIDEIREYNPGIKTNIKRGSIIYIPTLEELSLPEDVSTPKPEPVEVFHGDYGIFLIKKSKIEITPGSTSNVVVKLINNTDSLKEFHLKIHTPEGWNQLTDYASLIVERNSKRLKIFSFHIQDKTNVGDYNISIEAFDEEKKSSIGSITIPVYVRARYELLTRIMDIPDYVFSGDTLRVKFMIQNLSNVEAHVRASLINSNLPEIRNFTLAPDSMVITSVLVNASENIEYYTKNSISLSTSIIESPETNNDISCVFNVIPSSKVKFDAFNRIPVKISGLFVTDNQMGDRKYGGMFDVKGSGMISKRKLRKIEFHFRGPNRQGNPILGQTDEYYVQYNSLHSNAIVGDNTYRLSELTEGARYGRGVEYEHKLKKASMGAFLNYPRFYPNIKRVYSVFGSYFSGTKYSLNVGYLNKLFVTDSSANLFTLSGEANPFKWGSLNLEYASGFAGGKMTKAYSFGFKLNYSRYRLFFSYMHADEDFPGYVTNSMYLASGFTASLLRRLNISINYNISQFNIALDTMFSNAPYTDNLSLAVGYMLSYNHSLSISLNKRGSEDRRIPQQFDYDEYTARLTLQSKLKRFKINVYGAYGKTKNYLVQSNDQITNVFNSNLTVNYTIHKNVFVKVFVSYLGGEQYLSDDYTRLFYGGLVNAHWNDKLSVNFQYQNNYEVEEYYKDRSLFALNTNYIVTKNHELEVGVNYDLKKNYLNNTRLSASLKYTYTINVPVSRRDDLGSLQGIVINNGVDEIEGIIFTLNGNIAVSDKNGEFEFPYVRPGSHFLFIDYSVAGLNTIAETPGPYIIDVLPGEKFNFEVAITKSGKISGKILISEDENIGKKGFIPIKEEVKNLIIEANNGREVYRMFTNKDGVFDFEDLRPGRWTIKVYDRGIPKGYVLENDVFNVDLKSEQLKHIDVIIKKKSRKIKFQKKL